MSKKWFSLLGVVFLVFAIGACSNDNDKNDSLKENIEEENQANENEIVENELDDSNESPFDEETDEMSEEDVSDQEKQEKIFEDARVIALINKQYALDENYVPDDLVTVDVPTILENPEVNQLREVAADALKSMFDKGKESGIYLYARSGYRSYNTQAQLFKNYANKHGEEAANRYSARPGHSEHQTGLVMDVTSESVNYQLTSQFGETAEGQWVREHAHEFGFIIRYPEGSEEITGYIYEPWHLRYLGPDMAREVYESGLTYEEYIEREGLIDEVIAYK